jgi:hypothetical protein
MAFSYSGDPSKSLLDAVRFEISDTNSRAPLLQNAEIEYALAREAPGEPPSEGEVLSAAARCMETLARLFSAQADTELGSLKVVNTKRAKGYTERAQELRARASHKHAPWIGGQSKSEKAALADQDDRVQPAFRRNQFDTPYSGPTGGPGPVGPGEQQGREP